MIEMGSIEMKLPSGLREQITCSLLLHKTKKIYALPERCKLLFLRRRKKHSKMGNIEEFFTNSFSIGYNLHYPFNRLYLKSNVCYVYRFFL